jgi:hypothetical protein
MDDKPPDSFWVDNVCKSYGKHNVSPHLWEKICKIRNTPIRLLKDLMLGSSFHRPYTVLPKGLKGYIIDHPEAFCISDDDLYYMSIEKDLLPVAICGYGEVVFLSDGDYEVIAPFFDMSLADMASMSRIEGES